MKCYRRQLVMLTESLSLTQVNGWQTTHLGLTGNSCSGVTAGTEQFLISTASNV